MKLSQHHVSSPDIVCYFPLVHPSGKVAAEAKNRTTSGTLEAGAKFKIYVDVSAGATAKQKLNCMDRVIASAAKLGNIIINPKLFHST